MKVPEKIYLNSYGSGFSHGFSSKKQHDNDIEYIRSDTFIEKAWDWIEDNLLSSNQQDKSHLYLEQFKNHMKGE
jgi:hypothetical protein